jgi:hypothetical protein
MRATTAATAVRVCGSVAARSSSSSRVPPPPSHAAAPTVHPARLGALACVTLPPGHRSFTQLRSLWAPRHHRSRLCGVTLVTVCHCGGLSLRSRHTAASLSAVCRWLSVRRKENLMVSLARAGRLACGARDWPSQRRWMSARGASTRAEGQRPGDSAQSHGLSGQMKPVSVVPSSKTRRHRRRWLPSRGARVRCDIREAKVNKANGYASTPLPIDEGCRSSAPSTGSDDRAHSATPTGRYG